MEEFLVIYWAAASLAFWADGGVTKLKLARAIDMVCRKAKLTVPQEALLKKLVQGMMT